MKFVSCLFGLLIVVIAILARPVDESDIEKLINKLYSQLINREADKNAKKAPRTLIVDPNIENFNVYLDDAPAAVLDEDAPDVAVGNASASPKKSRCAKKHDPYGMPLPFPAFISPLMTLLATDYTAWRSKIPPNVGCLVEELLAVDSHPCPHENNSCVIIALPKNHVFFGCMNDQTGELVAPKRWNPRNETDSDNKEGYLIDFRVPNPLRLDRKCRTNEDGSPICHRANIFYKDKIIAEDNACCCKGDFCADVLFDQHGFNPVPFLHIQTDIPQRILAADAVAPPNDPKPDKPRSRSHRQSDSESNLASNADSSTAVNSGLDWGFTQTESIAIGLIIFVILVVVITIGLWFIFEREKKALSISKSTKAEIDSRSVDVFTVDTTDDYPFTVHKQGRSII
uniref:CX domain-containing protein n=1 Tax=Panagrellus redivivus TaxID=6233 RepID=A0A7E4VRA3_PANRE